MIDHDDLIADIREFGEVWVHLYNGVTICLVGVDGDNFVGKFTPCAENAQGYKIHSNQVKEYR